MLFSLLLILPFVTLSHLEEAEELCPCEIPTEEIQTCIDQMYEVVHHTPNLEGLAAPQVGIPLRIILVNLARVSDPSHWQEFINPEIFEKETDRILLFAYNRQGLVITEEYAGDLARIFQEKINLLAGEH